MVAMPNLGEYVSVPSLIAEKFVACPTEGIRKRCRKALLHPLHPRWMSYEIMLLPCPSWFREEDHSENEMEKAASK